MSLIYPGEPVSCSNYTSNIRSEFSIHHFSEGEKFSMPDRQYTYLLFIRKGEVSVSCNEFADCRFVVNQMILLPKNSYHAGIALKESDCILLASDGLSLPCNKLQMEKAASYAHKISYVFRALEINEPLKKMLDSVEFYLQHNLCCKHVHIVKQQELSLILHAFYKREDLISFFLPLINKNFDFYTFVRENYLSVKTVEELAELCHMAPRSFNRKFKAYFDMSPYSWMLKHKANHIKGELMDDRITFADIINKYGFSSWSHFTTFCKRHFGLSPSEMRKRKDI